MKSLKIEVILQIIYIFAPITCSLSFSFPPILTECSKRVLVCIDLLVLVSVVFFSLIVSF